MQHRVDTWVQQSAEKGPVILLESQSMSHPEALNTYIAAEPRAMIKAWGDTIEIWEDGKKLLFRENPWQALQAFRKRWDDWMFGYLGYDLKNFLEKLQSSNNDLVGAPDLFFMVPNMLLKIDQKKCVTVLKGTFGGTGKDVSERMDVHGLKPVVSKSAYLSIIKQAQEQIYEGQFYEINLSHPLKARFEGAAFKLYQKMRRLGPVPFGAYIKMDDIAICSMSPERFLCKKDNNIYSQPIKGTIKRHKNEKKDQLLKEKLAGSVKNRAENMIIVDLVRNDLSRISIPGSISVSDLFQIQSFGTVHQMVSTISGQVALVDPIEIIQACYPMGSMTGAPKVRVMQAIEDLEVYKRGVYSGAIGYISPEGDFDFNVVIRTAIIKNNLLVYPVGGAITADSDAEDEWHETWLKAKALSVF